MTENLKSTRVSKFRPSDSSFASNNSAPSFSNMSIEEDPESTDNYKAMLSKQEDEVYYRRFFILAIFIHFLMLGTVILYYFYIDVIKTSNGKMNISFTSITYNNNYYMIFNCFVNCPNNNSCFNQNAVLADNNLTCNDFKRLFAYNITVS